MYKGELEDNELLILIDYLDSINGESNFRTIEKRNWRRKCDQLHNMITESQLRRDSGYA